MWKKRLIWRNDSVSAEVRHQMCQWWWDGGKFCVQISLKSFRWSPTILWFTHHLKGPKITTGKSSWVVVNFRYFVSITRSRLQFQASVKCGNLVEEVGGPLLISCQYVPLLCSNDPDLIHQHIHQNIEHLTPEQETPLDLSSVIKLEIKEEAVTREEKDQDSGYIPSPPLVDLTNTPDEDFSQLVSVLTLS